MILFSRFYRSQFLGIILSTPYLNLKFDTLAVQNWQGFWFSLTTNSIFQFCYTSIITYQSEFTIIHREVSNDIYALSAYYTSQIVITVCLHTEKTNTDPTTIKWLKCNLLQFIWTTVEVLLYTYVVFWTVGINWEFLVVTTFLINMLVCRSYGNLTIINFKPEADRQVFGPKNLYR